MRSAAMALAFACDDCNGILMWLNLLGGGWAGDWYMVKDRVWRRGQRRTPCRFLCVQCLEHRIGRRLSARDFKRSAKVNFEKHSARLRHRMRGLKPAKRLVNTTFNQ